MAEIGAVILAGGLSRRMEGPEKSLVALQGVPMLQHVIDRITPQVTRIALNANGDHGRFNDFGLPVVADDVPDHPGPLAGLLAGLEWMGQNQPSITHVLTLPCDTPVLPKDLVSRLQEALDAEGAALAMASSGGRVHPVVGLWSVSLAEDLRQGLVIEGIRKVRMWTDRHKTAIVEWPAEPFDPFANINTPDELTAAGDWLSSNN